MFEPQRLHPLGIADYVINNLYKQLGAWLPMVILLYNKPAGKAWLLPLLGIMLGLFLLYAFFYWYRYFYYIKDHELRLEYGVLSRKKRYIPLERIQSVQITAGIPQRIFGLVKLQVETAGGSTKAEVVLPNISRDQAEALRQFLQNATTPIEDDTSSDLIEYRLSGGSLLLAATTSNRIGFIFAGLLALLSQIDQFFPQAAVYQLLDRYAEGLLTQGWIVIVVFIILVFLLAWLISLVSEMIKLGGFHLLVEGDKIKINHGLLEKRQVTLPIKRIQAVEVIQGLLRQPFGLVSLRVVSAAYGGEKGEANLLFPLLTRNEVLPFLTRVVPDFAVENFDLEGLPARSAKRYFLFMLAPISLVTGACSIWIPWGYYSLLLLLPSAWLAYLQFSDTGWKLDGKKLLIRSRFIGQVTSIIPHRRIQSLAVAQTYFQERNELATIKAALASGVGARIVKVVGLDITQSRAVEEWFGSNTKVH